MNILQLTKLTFSSKSWKISQLLNIITEVVMKFLTIMLLVLSYDEKEVILVFFWFYFFSFIFLIIYKRVLFRFKKIFYSTFLVLIFLSVLTYFLTQNYLFFLMCITFVMTSRDLFNTSSYWELNNIAEKNNVEWTKLIGFSYVLWVVLSVLALPFSGIIADNNLNYFIYFILIVIFLIFFYYTYINFKDFKNKEVVSKNKIKTPKTVYLQSLLSSLCWTTAFFGVRFLFPLFMLNVFSKYWLDKNIFFIIWVISWIIALLNLISRKGIKLPKNKDLMINNYLIYVFCWFLFWVLFYIFFKIDNKILEYIIIFLVIILNIIMEFSWKLRSVWFIQYLKDQAHFYSNNEKTTDTYNSYLTTFVIFKALGWAFAFWLAYLLYSILNLENIIIIFSVISIIYWIYIKKYFNNLTF